MNKHFQFLYRLLILFAVTICSSQFAPAQTVYYVDAARADNTGTGKSWVTAKRDIQNAITTAVSGDQVWVKAGTYKPTQEPDGTTDASRDFTFYLKNGVQLYGGFSGTEISLNQRNYSTNVTSLSGDIGTVGTATDNCYHVVLSVNDDSTTVLDGFIIKSGYAGGPASITVETIKIWRYYAGGMYNESSNPTISNCVFSGNTVTTDIDWSNGGGMCNASSSPNINNCIFSNNTASSKLITYGGGMSNRMTGGTSNGKLNSSPTITNCVFVNNIAISGSNNAQGGGIYNEGNLIMSNCIFINNTSGTFGGAMSNAVGAKPTISSCSLYCNKAGLAGGGFYSDHIAGGILTNCILWNNTTDYPGYPNRDEIYSNNTTSTKLIVSNCIVKDATGIPLRVLNTTMSNSLNSDPLFASVTNLIGADNIWMTADDGLRIPCNSPAKNTGASTTPTTDIIGNTRTSSFDMGAYQANNGTTLSNNLPATNTTVNIFQAANDIVNYTDCTNQIVKVDGTTPLYNISGDIIAKVWIEATQPTQFVKRHYEITPVTNTSTATAKLTLYFTQQEFTDYNNQVPAPALLLPTGGSDATGKANLLIEKRSGISSNNIGLPDTYPIATTPVTIDPDDADIVWDNIASRWQVSFNVTGFSGFFVKTESTILPLHLLNFSGSKQNGGNKLQWQTSGEVNTKQFELESGIDGSSFIKIATIPSTGNSNGNYSFTDITAYTGKKYYKLKMVDYDGRFTYSNILWLSNETKGLVSIYPNPATGQVFININKAALLNTGVNLYDVHGRLLKSILIKQNPEQINIEQLSKGIYLLKFEDGTVAKFIK